MDCHKVHPLTVLRCVCKYAYALPRGRAHVPARRTLVAGERLRLRVCIFKPVITSIVRAIGRARGRCTAEVLHVAAGLGSTATGAVRDDANREHEVHMGSWNAGKNKRRTSMII